VGETDSARVLVVVFTMRGDLIRLVTAFEGSRRTRTLYRIRKKG
jgi:uncharacterized DUF497 family protein